MSNSTASLVGRCHHPHTRGRAATVHRHPCPRVAPFALGQRVNVSLMGRQASPLRANTTPVDMRAPPLQGLYSQVATPISGLATSSYPYK
ncbi:hypothetical protein B296_00002666 [Ensete ventricosum]|uniref:Uncharacterized protein n=1 Tax=Ensete ventricosum TaxID=4639 RepID=A0A427AU68_ENSVE|nr:hypothetical protein B296_00002666 [Ensete ventricosum]